MKNHMILAFKIWSFLIAFHCAFATAEENQDESYKFKIVKRGYQILDPGTGYVLPPSLNTFKRGPTRKFTRPDNKKKHSFSFPTHFSFGDDHYIEELEENHEFEEKNFYHSSNYDHEGPEPEYYFPDRSNHDNYIGFDSDSRRRPPPPPEVSSEDYHGPYHGDSPFYHRGSTKQRRPGKRGRGTGFFGGGGGGGSGSGGLHKGHSSNHFDVPSPFSSFGGSGGGSGSFFKRGFSSSSNGGYTSSSSGSHHDYDDRHKVFKKQTDDYEDEDEVTFGHHEIRRPYQGYSSGGGDREDFGSSSSSSSHQQPHKYRKKYPYYGRKKRSPLELLDPMTGRTIQRPIIRQQPRQPRQQRLPIRGSVNPRPPFGNEVTTGSNIRSNRHLLRTGSSRQLPLSFYGGAGEVNVRAARANRFFRNVPNFGREYYSSHSGLPVYKYIKKHPHGYYGRRRREATPSDESLTSGKQGGVCSLTGRSWVLLDPWTGRNVDPPSVQDVLLRNEHKVDPLFQDPAINDADQDAATRQTRDRPSDLEAAENEDQAAKIPRKGDTQPKRYHIRHPYKG